MTRRLLLDILCNFVTVCGVRPLRAVVAKPKKVCDLFSDFWSSSFASLLTRGIFQVSGGTGKGSPLSESPECLSSQSLSP